MCRAGFVARRVRIAVARSGETLKALSARTGNIWGSEATGVMNGLPADVRLRVGQRIKIAFEEPYLGGTPLSGAVIGGLCPPAATPRLRRGSEACPA